MARTSVTGEQIGDGSIQTVDIADLAVTTVKITNSAVTDAKVAAANKDGLATVPSMRTLGTGATQAVAGNDARLSDARAPTAHTHTFASLTVKPTTLSGYGITDAEYMQPVNTVRGNLGNPTVSEKALFHGQFNNKFRFTPAGLQEESVDNVTWTTSTRMTAAQLGDIMIGEGDTGGANAIPAPAVGGQGHFRLTWDYATAGVGYICLNNLYCYNSTNGNTIRFSIEAFHNTNGWEAIASGNENNWPGHTNMPHSAIWFSANATQYSKVRVTFSILSAAYANAFTLYGLEWFGGYPSGKRNVQSYDRLKNVTFPAVITGTRLTSTIATGTAPLTVASTTVVTNLNADLVDGLHVATSATANTVVARDVNGYIYGTFLNSNRVDENSAAASYTYDAGDGWIRKKTLANARLELVTSASVTNAIGTPWTSYLPLAGGTLTGQVNIPNLNSIMTNGSRTNLVVTNNSAAIAQSPTARFWHDLLAFCKNDVPTYETNNGTTWSSATLNKELFSQKENQSIPILTTNIKGARWTWSQKAWSYAEWVNLGVTWVATAPLCRMLVESSPDGITWTTVHTSTNNNNEGTVLLLAIPRISPDNYLRLSLIWISGGVDVNLSNIKLLTSRPGDQGGGSETAFPYTWDGNQNISFPGNIGIGTVNNGVNKVQIEGTIKAFAATTSDQVVIKSQLDLKANDNSVIHNSGTETRTGILNIVNNGSLVDGTDANRIDITQNGALAALNVTVNNNRNGQLTTINGAGIGLSFNNLSSTSGTSLYGYSSGSGKSIVLNNATAATGAPFTIQKNSVDVITMTDDGKITATAGTSSTHVVVKSQLDLKAPLASPTFTGTINNTSLAGTGSRAVVSDANGNLSAPQNLYQQGSISASGDITAYSSSDKRLKDNITVIPDALAKIQRIGGYEFDWNSNQDTYSGHDIGVIAQEIEDILPELVITRDNGYKAVKYDKLVALLIEGIKEQQKRIVTLENLILN